jgi:hypothetical protein
MSVKHTQKVSRLCVIAREEGMLPWEWIVDQGRQEEKVATWSDPAAYARAVQSSYRRNKWDAQPTHVSVWSEKGTVEGTLRPVLEKYEVPFQVLHGWSGATPVYDAAQANLRRDQKTLILYVGDYDPSGMGMSEVDLPRRLWRYSAGDPREDKDVDPAVARRGLAEINLEIRRIALTTADTIELGAATRFPASDKGPKGKKKGDSRYPWFVANYGHWCWELDALSPNALRDRIEQAILAELNHETWDRYVEAERVEQEAIVATCQSWKSILEHVSK